MFPMSSDAMRNQMLTLAFIHPMFIGFAMAAIFMTGMERQFSGTAPAAAVKAG
jgi:hypothetical protein